MVEPGNGADPAPQGCPLENPLIPVSSAEPSTWRSLRRRQAGDFPSRRRQTACKPGSVPLRAADLQHGAVTAIPLGCPSPGISCDRPERRREGPPGHSDRSAERSATACRSYLVLLPVGFSLPPPLPVARCALAAPFHPCRPPAEVAARGLGGVFSVALSLRSPSPGVTRHRSSVEPGLSSRCAMAKSGRPAVWPRLFGVLERRCQSPTAVWRLRSGNPVRSGGHRDPVSGGKLGPDIAAELRVDETGPAAGGRIDCRLTGEIG